MTSTDKYKVEIYFLINLLFSTKFYNNCGITQIKNGFKKIHQAMGSAQLEK